jgi:hypothetical protein
LRIYLKKKAKTVFKFCGIAKKSTGFTIEKQQIFNHPILCTAKKYTFTNLNREKLK